MTKFDKVKELGRLRDSSSRPLFMLLEGNYYLHRAYHTYPHFSNASGVPTGAVSGFLSMLCADYSALRPDYVAVCFDVPGVNFRHAIYDQYKLNDPLDPVNVELGIQLLILVRLVRLLGIQVLFLRGVESDDVVGALSTHADEVCGEPVNVLVFTGDKDLNQLVTKRVVTVDTRDSGWIGTPDSVKKKFGVWPNQIASYLALTGDSNDGIPGVPSIGPGKAAKLLEEFGSVPNLLKASPAQLGNWRRYLTPSALANLRRDFRLATIRTDVNVAKHGPYHLHAAHGKYLQQALNALNIRRLPSLIKAQLEAVALRSSTGLFDDGDTKFHPLVEDSKEWDGLMGNLWEHKTAWEDATFRD